MLIPPKRYLMYKGQRRNLNKMVKYAIVLRQLEIHQCGGRERDKLGFPGAGGRRLSLGSPVLSLG